MNRYWDVYVNRYNTEFAYPKVQERVNQLKLDWLNTSAVYHSPEVAFYTKEDIQRMSGWSEEDVRLLFFDRRFPSCNFGRKHVVEVHALISFFAVRDAVQRREQLLQELME